MVPENLLAQLAPGGVLLYLSGKLPKLIQVTLTPEGFEQTIVEDVFFVPMLEGVQHETLRSRDLSSRYRWGH